jgi:hypothetical protein
LGNGNEVQVNIYLDVLGGESGEVLLFTEFSRSTERQFFVGSSGVVGFEADVDNASHASDVIHGELWCYYVHIQHLL